ncbi:ABC transporter ATP-binding protein [Rhodococcoides kyotonense]|uniref:Peptide/nickel transport system ATP-binding protein n=1 Tax=Rhodococcoides kyotonense TaxID=398843 RepID=A0A239DZI3_9NOCA|nr:ATP-binding cassette domain-containing protein [Rhodococcus kyotonensis]SNS37866.1 peptide/nickel transport system ATP-binding protein [Rhodococcus kyotonensis]
MIGLKSVSRADNLIGDEKAASHVDLTAQGVVREFGPMLARHRAVDSVDLAIDETTRLGIVGESGSGKSTLARMLAGLDTPTAGSIDFGGQSLSTVLSTRAGRALFRRSVQFISQDTTSSFDPRHTLVESVTRPIVTLFGASKQEALDLALQTFRDLSLPVELATRYPSQVSGGQRQRFAIARALVVRPKLLICDEVASALDVSVQGSILNLLKSYCMDNGAGLVFVSHGLPATAFITDEIAVMFHGKVVELGPTRAVLENPQHPYTKMLLAAHGSSHRQAQSA